MMGQANSTNVQTDPGATPFINDVLSGAQGLYGNQNQNATLPENISTGVGMEQDTANWLTNYNPFKYTPLYTAGAIASGQGREQPTIDAAIGNLNTTAGQYATPESQAQNVYDTLGPLAGNTSGALTSTQQAILDQNAERQSNRLASLYSGSGRTGSFGAGIGMARGISETNNPLIAQFQQQNVQNALQANQGRLGASGQYGSLLGGQGGMYGAAGNLGAQSQAQQLGAAGMIPGIEESMFSPAQHYQHAASMQQSYPWENLRNYASTIAGLGGFIPRTSTNMSNTTAQQIGSTAGTSQTATPWTTFAGLGLAGAGMFLAKGGPARGGRPYIVGEKGPELFIPRAAGGPVRPTVIGARGPQLFRPPVSGQVIPNNALRGPMSAAPQAPQSLSPQVRPGLFPGRAWGGPVHAGGARMMRQPLGATRGPMAPRAGGAHFGQALKMGLTGTRRPMSPWALGA